MGMVQDKLTLVVVALNARCHQSGSKEKNHYITNFLLIIAKTLVDDFGNFDMYRFVQPFKLEDLLNLALEEWNNNPQKTPVTKFQVEKRVNQAVKVLTENAVLLFDYFSIEIDSKSGHFLALPILLAEYIPQLEGLADFSLKLAENIDRYRRNELECLRSICRLTSEFYSLKRKFCTTDGKTSAVHNAALDWRWVVEHLLYPKFKNSNFSPDKNLVTDGILRKLTDLKDLYKVFERC
uniref:DNA mismatch repair protein Mlh1 C-terminal domain-containing protein n=1 Tax=Romanomermis culicivorax TaxID=13658 RepID=A0A915KMS1_ROMCU